MIFWKKIIINMNIPQICLINIFKGMWQNCFRKVWYEEKLSITSLQKIINMCGEVTWKKRRKSKKQGKRMDLKRLDRYAVDDKYLMFLQRWSIVYLHIHVARLHYMIFFLCFIWSTHELSLQNTVDCQYLIYVRLLL